MNPATTMHSKHINVSDDSATRRFPRLWKEASRNLTECEFAHTLNGARTQDRRTGYGRACWERIAAWRARSSKTYFYEIAGIRFEIVRAWTRNNSIAWQAWPLRCGYKHPLPDVKPTRRELIAAIERTAQACGHEKFRQDLAA
jgi:hypothetical protein